MFTDREARLCRGSALNEVRKAEDLSWLLPGHDDFEYAAELTALTLRRAEVWAAVAHLVVERERIGTLAHGIRGLLPAALPGWPPRGVSA